MAGQIEVYRKEIFNFLRTVTIKFTPFAYLMGQDYMETYGLDDPNGKWNPYYINLCGEYSSKDEVMTVYSVELERQVLFDKDLKTKYPKTAALYRIPNQEYTNLEEKYGNQIGLIKSIAYPVSDIQTAIDAPNLSLLAYDSSLLDVNERESLIKTLNDFLAEVRTRWWVEEFAYEDMYATTFWCMLWQLLPLVLLTARFLNIRTSAAHTFHIWQYLRSKGLGDYRDALSNKQALWLYRNINYILRNKGKTSNLTKLAENLLGDIAVSLLYKNMYQETGSRWNDCITNPEFKSFSILTNKEEKTESFATLNQRLVNLDLEDRNSSEYIDETELNLAQQNMNILPTKFLEFKKDSVNTATMQLMANSFLGGLMTCFHHNRCSFLVTMVDPESGDKISLALEDAILLWNWSLYRAIGQLPDKLPNRYTVYRIFKPWDPINEIREKIGYHHVMHRMDAWLDLNKMYNLVTWSDETWTSQVEFLQYLAHNYRALATILNHMENSSSYIYHEAVQAWLDDTTVNECLSLTWGTTATTFSGWIARNENISNIVNSLERHADSDRSEAYALLAKAAYTALFPTNDAGLEDDIGSVMNMDSIYTSVRDLFIKLCSYNVTYLDTERDVNRYMKVYDPDAVFNTQTKYTYSMVWNMIMERFKYKHKDAVDLGIRDKTFDYGVKRSKMAVDNGCKIYVDYKSSHTLTLNYPAHSVIHHALDLDEQVITLNLKLHFNHTSINTGSKS